MQTQFKITSLIATLSVLVGCTSLTKRGYKALDEGQYEEALTLFERATVINTNDGKARDGLRKAQQEWINKKLIEVRLLRLAENIADSEKLLLKIIQNEKGWKVFPSGVVFSTQKEEIQFFSDRVEQKIKTLLNEKNPIAAQVEFNKSDSIIGEAMDQNQTILKNKIYTAAISYCRENQKSLKAHEYYTAKWLRQTCSAWQIPIAVNAARLKNSISLFKNTSINSNVSNLSYELQKIFDNNIQKAFTESKWYDPNGKVILNLHTTGNFKSSVAESKVQRTHHYTVDIPYEETYTRKKNQSSSGSSGVLGLITLLAGLDNEYIDDNGDGTETVTVTKYRTESRYYYYNATELKTRKSLSGKIESRIDNQAFVFDFKQKIETQGDRHKVNFPDIGLTPTNPQILPDDVWIQTVSYEVMKELETKLQQSWLERFCVPATEKSDVSEREASHRCAYQVTAVAPESLKQFYLKTLKINYEDWQQLVQPVF